MPEITAVQVMEKQILELVESLKEALFTDFEEQVEGFIGDFALCPVDSGQVFYWDSLSEIACEALANLQKNKQVFFQPTHSFLYLVDGKIPAYPLATAVGLKKGYKTSHWIPIAVCLSPRAK